MATTQDLTTGRAFLLGPSPAAIDIFDPTSGRALLVPGLRLPPPVPSDGAMRIGIVDSGVIAAHPQLAPLVIAERAFAGDDPQDTIGHGTQVALQAVRSHADPEIQRLLGDRFSYPAILSARVTDDLGVPSVDAVIAAIDWLVEQGAQVINLSLGFRGEASDYRALCQTISRHSEVFFAAAAGNFGPDVAVYPAACAADNLTSVGEVRAGQVADSSGSGAIYASSDMPLVHAWQYHYEAGVAAAQAGDHEQARDAFAASVAQQANTPALFQLALLDIQDDDLAAAEDRLRQTLALEPQLATLHAHLGTVLYLRGDYPTAISHLRQALVVDQGDQMARFNLGQVLLATDRPAEALEAFEQLKAQNPDYPRVDAALAEARARARQDRP